MIVYSVTVAIDPIIEKDWVNWMKTIHIPDVMNTNYFIDYRFCKVQPIEGIEQISYNISYRCESNAKLQEYQAKHAPQLQKEHADRYDGKFAAFRTLLDQIDGQ